MNKEEYKTLEELKEELGDKFEEYMYKANIELLEQNKKYKEVIDSAIEYIENEKHKQKGIGVYTKKIHKGLLDILKEVE